MFPIDRENGNERTDGGKRKREREPKQRKESERARRKTSSADNVALQRSSHYEEPLNTFITTAAAPPATHISHTNTRADETYTFLSASLLLTVTYLLMSSIGRHGNQ